MRYYVCTLFPDLIHQIMETSIIGRAARNGVLSVKTINIRDFSQKKSMRVDDYPYGGGAGMVMEPEPVYEAVQAALRMAEEDRTAPEKQRKEGNQDSFTAAGAGDKTETPSRKCRKPRVIYLTPQAKVLDQTTVEELAREEELILLCGHYEGIDERVLQQTVTDYISIGDYVLTGGELGAAVLMDAVSRFVPGVLHNEESSQFESLQDNLLEYPHFTRPEVWHGQAVPPVLLTGDHKKIEDWRYQQAVQRTQERRPDLLKNSFTLHTFWYGSPETESFALELHSKISRYGEVQNYNRNKLIRSRTDLGDQDFLLLAEGESADEMSFADRFRNLYGSGKSPAWLLSDSQEEQIRKKTEFLSGRGFQILGTSRFSEGQTEDGRNGLALEMRKKALHLAGR